LWESDVVIDYPLNERLVNTSRGVVVHSRFIENRLKQKHPDLWLRKINHISEPDVLARGASSIRSEFGIPDDALLMGSFGFMTPAKRIQGVLKSMAVTQQRFPVHYLLVGELVDPEIEKSIKQLGLEATVHVTGYVNEARFLDLIQACEICINLRFPTMGETSGVLCRCLRIGKPCIVTDAGWYAELPDNIVYKIAANDQEVNQLVAVLEEFRTDPGPGRLIGENGQSYMTEYYDTDKIVDNWVQAFRDLLS
jgi:glycosyltransferase involved in cell wall biosynthesis